MIFQEFLSFGIKNFVLKEDYRIIPPLWVMSIIRAPPYPILRPNPSNGFNFSGYTEDNDW